MKTFAINVSEVAALLGYTPWKSQEEAIQDCINRNTKGLPPQEAMKAREIALKNKELRKIQADVEKSSEKTETIEEVQEKKKEVHAKIDEVQTKKVETVKAEFDEKIAKATAPEEKAKLAVAKEAEVKKVEADTKILKAHSESKFNTNFGTRKEEAAGKTYEALTGMKIVKDNKLQILKIYDDKVKVLGRFDGFAEDGTLVEIKNRSKKLFNAVYPSENTQIQLYLRMAGKTEAHLVEKYRGEILIHDVEADENLTDEIIAKLEELCEDHFKFFCH